MRPNFLTSPGVWVRASRLAQSEADYACSIERSRPHGWGLGTLIRAALCIAAAALIGAMLAQGV